MPDIRQFAFVIAFFVATTIGWAGSCADLPTDDAASASPLEPPDTSSPRATLQTFLTNARAGVLRFRSGDSLHAVRRDVSQALATFDLPPPRSPVERDEALDSLVLLLDVLNRVPLPPIDDIPDAAQATAAGLARWRVPGTEIAIVKQAEGPRAGEFLFSKETLARVPEFSARASVMPVTPEGARTGDALLIYRTAPGIHAPAWLQRLVAALPAPFHATLLGTQIWKWLALSLSVAAALLVMLGALRVQRLITPGQSGELAARVTGSAVAAMLILVTWAVQFAIVGVIRLTGQPALVALGVTTVVHYAAVAWLAWRVLGTLGDLMIEQQQLRPASLDSQLIRLVFRLLGIGAVIYVAVFAADQLDLPVAPLLAGLGVGGLAIALAVRPTLENVVGGFVLFADKPVRVGEFCRFGDKQGTVEEIGLRSTRVRALDRTLVTVPNAEFAQLQIVNLARRDRMLLQETIGLRYETKPDQLRFVLAKIRELLVRHPKVSMEPARARFAGFGASSLDIDIFAFVDTQNYNEYLAVREDVNLRIADIVAEAGTGFAFPSQTVYLARDGGLDAERTQHSEAEVERWRTEQRLPFPELPEELRYELSGKLDYPPPGSPDAPRPSS